MRQLVDNLSAEHLDLRLAIRILRAMAAEVAGGGPFPAEDCARVLQYLRDFAIGVHFEKESQTLLTSVAVFGSPRDVEAAGAVLRAQEQAKELLHTLILFWEPTGDLTAIERQGFFGTVRALTRTLERGMLLEERLLFPALPRVPVDDRLGWAQGFAAIEQGRRSAREWRTELEGMADRWSVG